MSDLVERAVNEARKIRMMDAVCVRVFERDGQIIWSKIDDDGHDLTASNCDGILYHLHSLFVPNGAVNPLESDMQTATASAVKSAASDLVERVARAIYEEDDPWHKAWPWPDLQSDQAGVDQYRRIAQAAIAAMQTDAAPALKPAVEVWQEASDAATDGSVKYQSHADQAAAAVIEADRQAIIADKDAEIAALKDAWQKQFDEKVKERDEAKLWFEKAQEWKRSLAALQAHADALAEYTVHQPDCRIGKPDCLGEEELCTCGLSNTLRAYEEFRRG